MNADATQMNVRQESLLRERERLNAISGRVIGAAQRVSSTLDYVPDLIVEDSLIVEVKAVQSIERPHRQQCLNYLRVSNLHLALLLNFGNSHLEVGRVVFRF